MKVLHLFKTYFPDSYGGTEQFINQLARGCSTRGVEVDVLSLTRESDRASQPIDGHMSHRARLDFEISSTGFSWQVIGRFKELAARTDIVHLHFPWPFMDVVHFATMHRKPTIITYHSDIVRQRMLMRFYRPLMNRFLASADRIVATSPNYLASSDVLSSLGREVDVVPIGLDKASYPDASEARLAAWRERVGDRFFLFVGMLRYYKGLHILLDALVGTGLPVVIVGAGPFESELQRHAEQLNLQNVHFLGQLPDEDKIALLTLSYATVFPSHLRSEAFGISLLEGAMFGKPLISSEIGTGTTFINVHGETGLVVPPGDPAALRAALLELTHAPEQAARMGRNARDRYQRLFTADLMTDSYMRIYQDTLAARHAR